MAHRQAHARAQIARPSDKKNETHERRPFPPPAASDFPGKIPQLHVSAFLYERRSPLGSSVRLLEFSHSYLLPSSGYELRRMSYKSVNDFCGVGLALLTGVAGAIVAILLAFSGNIHAYTGISSQSIIAALFLAVLFPAVTVRFLPAKWWCAALVFCPLLPIPLLSGILGQEWLRCLAALGSVAAAFASAWQFRPRNQTRLP